MPIGHQDKHFNMANAALSHLFLKITTLQSRLERKNSSAKGKTNEQKDGRITKTLVKEQHSDGILSDAQQTSGLILQNIECMKFHAFFWQLNHKR